MIERTNKEELPDSKTINWKVVSLINLTDYFNRSSTFCGNLNLCYILYKRKYAFRS